MTLNDAGILTKKILIGIAIAAAPLIIIGGGLWLISHYLIK